MMTMKKWISLLAVALFAMGMIGCDEMEEAADDTGDAMEEAADETVDAAENAADELDQQM